MNAAQIIRIARETRGLTRSQLAARAGVSLPTIYNIEEGKHEPQMKTMVIIMRAMDYEIVFKPRYRGGTAMSDNEIRMILIEEKKEAMVRRRKENRQIAEGVLCWTLWAALGAAAYIGAFMIG